jgi:ABC-type branched-subunit amino acid transport system ATPase component
MQNEILSAQGISVRFGGLAALSDIAIAFPSGRGIDAIIGPNGAGKTTLFNVFTGVVTPTEGKLILQGSDLTGLRPDQIFRRGISRTFQGVRLFEHLTVEQNVTMAARSTASRAERATGKLTPGWRDAADGQARAQRAMDLVEIDAAHRDRMPGRLSLWESRMVEIARAISPEPQVLLLDEPAAGFSASEKARLGALLIKISSELDCRLVVVEHDMSFVMSLAERVWVLNFGRLIARGTPAEVQADPLVRDAYLGGKQEDAA